MTRLKMKLALCAAAACLLLPVAEAATLRWAGAGDVSSMDPYARNETFLLTFTSNIYEPLLRRNKDLKPEPALAVKWGMVSPTTWFFDLRPNVKFSDGTPFSADDVVFSLNRANGKGSSASIRCCRASGRPSASCPEPGPRRTMPPTSPT
jgi:peptide/nickel transport system substrate-binding protein